MVWSGKRKRAEEEASVPSTFTNASKATMSLLVAARARDGFRRGVNASVGVSVENAVRGDGIAGRAIAKIPEPVW